MDYSYSYSYSGQLPPWVGLIWLALVVFFVYCGWKLFAKANQPGWAVLVPIYNIYILLKIAGKPGWWLVLYLIPLVNMIVAVIVMYNLSLRFGKGIGYTFGLLFLGFIFVPILALGPAKYTPVSSATPTNI